MACYLGLEFATQYCFFDIELERDNIKMVKALKSEYLLGDSCGVIIYNCKTLLNRFRFYKISHVKRQGNLTAHYLARVVLTKLNVMWLEETPLEICNWIYFDTLNCKV
ncbi:hypothetical protein AAHE18_12G170400 [Arachis hypogaea]